MHLEGGKRSGLSSLDLEEHRAVVLHMVFLALHLRGHRCSSFRSGTASFLHSTYRLESYNYCTEC